MAARNGRMAKGHRLMPSVLCAAALAVPSTGLALAGSNKGAAPSFAAMGFGVFTPASVDPALAARVQGKAKARGFRFTPAGAAPVAGERTVTVAVRVDDDSAQAINVRKAIDAVPGRGIAVAELGGSRFQLGAARGYKSFARPADLSTSVRSLPLPDLAQFKSATAAAEKPGRLQPRIELEGREIAGRSPNTLDSIGAQTVGLGGSFRLSPTLNVTAGVRYSQERERLDPLTNSVKDSQAVYVGTQIKF